MFSHFFFLIAINSSVTQLDGNSIFQRLRSPDFDPFPRKLHKDNENILFFDFHVPSLLNFIHQKCKNVKSPRVFNIKFVQSSISTTTKTRKMLNFLMKFSRSLSVDCREVFYYYDYYPSVKLQPVEEILCI